MLAESARGSRRLATADARRDALHVTYGLCVGGGRARCIVCRSRWGDVGVRAPGLRGASVESVAGDARDGYIRLQGLCG